MNKQQSQRDLFWINHVKQFLKSNLTQVEYCKRNKINPKSFSVRKSQYFKNQQKVAIENDNSNNFILLSNKNSKEIISITLPSGLELKFDKLPDSDWFSKILTNMSDNHACS